MLARNKQQELSLNQAKTKQRFAIRKLTIGAASVLLGLTFLGVTGNQVQAADGQSNEPATTEVANQKQGSPASTTTDTSANSSASTTADSSSSASASISSSTAGAQTTSATSAVDVTKSDNAAQKDVADKDKVLVPDVNNTEQPNKVNGQGENSNITYVPADGSIEYDYSISAKNKKSGQTEEVKSAEAGKDNNATLNSLNSDDIEAHLSLTNTTDKGVFIGNSDWGTNTDPTKHNDDEATLFINAWSANNDSLKIDATKGANVVFIQNGQIVNDDAFPVYYLAKDGKWYTYQDMVNNFGQNAVYAVKQIGFKGTIPGKTTAQMNVPLIIDQNATDLRNQISTKSYNEKSIFVTTTSTNKLWDESDVANDTLHIVNRNDDGTYTEIDDPELAAALPKVGDVLKITDSGNILDPDALYQGGTFEFSLAAIQAVLQKYGYSVNPDAKNSKALAYYTYVANGGLVVKKSDGSNAFDGSEATSDPYFYIEIHKILDTKDDTFEEGSSQAANWNAASEVKSVKDLTNPTKVSTGVAFTETAGDASKVEVISIKDANNNTVSAINASTPAGTYYVTYGYKLNDSDDQSMLITKTSKITITARPATPVTPVEPTAPTTPSEPTSPTTPAQPTAPADDNDDNVAPLPETDDNKGKSSDDNEETVAPKAQNVDAKSQNKSAKKSGNAAPAALANAKVNGASAKAAKLANSTKSANGEVSQKNALPQTGEKKSELGLIGLAFAAAAALIGLAGYRKEN